MQGKIVIETASGKIEGFSKAGISRFRGIPYARAERFTAPQTINWTGVLECTRYGPGAPQIIDPSVNPEPNLSEKNCLNLNIWTKSANPGELKPVMFWIHGGGFHNGSGVIVGSKIVNQGDIVLVSINYRLGPLGFMFDPSIPANLGLQDQVAALKWVQNNISNFGGNPDNVTIFGGSAGGQSVTALMTMPSAKGLFKRAIAQSGTTNPIGNKGSGGNNLKKMILSELSVETIGELRKLDYKVLFNANAKVTAGKFGESKVESLYPPYIDGNILPKHPLEAFRDGFAKDVDFITGTCENEFKFWSLFEPNLMTIDEKAVIERINGVYKPKTGKQEEIQQILNSYKNARGGIRPTTPYDLLDAFLTDFGFRIPAIRFVEAQYKHNPNTYMYFFTMKLPGKEEEFGALHGMETNFVFGNLLEEVSDPIANKDPFAEINPKKTPISEKLSSNLMNSWINFARTGIPNHKGIPEWKSYETKNRFTMKFDAECDLISNPMGIENEIFRKYLF